MVPMIVRVWLMFRYRPRRSEKWVEPDRSGLPGATPGDSLASRLAIPSRFTAWALGLASILALGCGKQPAGPDAPAAPARGAGSSKVRPIDADWVTIYDPKLAWNGYTLTLHEIRIPVLLDMNGRPVHSWPEARLKTRVRLLPDGSILGIGMGRQVVEYDWEGRRTWEFRTTGAIPHHDVLRLANGNTLVLVLKDGEGADTLFEVDRAGQVVWTWRAAERLGALIPPRPAHPNDITHINSLQELPENPWYTAGDARFRPGNLLLSARNLNTIFIVDRPSGEVVWSFKDGLDRQHEALMNGPDLLAPGMIQLFNNRLRSFASDRQSELIELDPRDNSAVWKYRSPGFFSPTGGVQQALPNGNVLVTSTRGGRVFEVTREGEIAWEWVPPYEPVRAVRVAPDACPQLAKLAAPIQTAVVPPPGYRYVDRESYRFARRGSRMKAIVSGEPRMVLKQETDCRDLVLPATARLRVGYGIDRGRLRGTGRADRPPRFAVRLRPTGASAEIDLLQDAVGLEGPAWRQRTIPLDAYGLQSVRLCVAIDGSEPGERFAYWEQPLIAAAGDARVRMGEDEDDEAAPAQHDLSPEELEVRRRHLKALGYAG